MQHVITESQARAITGGRKPHVPVQYEDAVRALDACLNLDEAKLWSDKADALAAWAKLYRDSQVERKAKALKLYAYRRMGQLAAELRPAGKHGSSTGTGAPLGARSVLVEAGLKRAHAGAALALTRIPADRFERELQAPIPRSPLALGRMTTGGISPEGLRAYQLIMNLQGLVKKKLPRALAAEFQGNASLQNAAIAGSEWLDDFARALGKC